MKWMDAIERKMGRRYIRDLMKYLCIAMAGVFVLEYLPLSKSAYALLAFDRAAIMRGEIWRIITFVFLPPSGSIFWIIISLYFYYFLGSGLESRWGGARFNLYYLLGVICNIAAGFITGHATNEYLNLSLLLCFAVIYPEVRINIFYFLPVKVKWIGLADGLYLCYQLLIISWPRKLALLVSMLPVLLFCGGQLWMRARVIVRRLTYKWKA